MVGRAAFVGGGKGRGLRPGARCRILEAGEEWCFVSGHAATYSLLQGFRVLGPLEFAAGEGRAAMETSCSCYRRRRRHRGCCSSCSLLC